MNSSATCPSCNATLQFEDPPKPGFRCAECGTQLMATLEARSPDGDDGVLVLHAYQSGHADLDPSQPVRVVRSLLPVAITGAIALVLGATALIVTLVLGDAVGGHSSVFAAGGVGVAIAILLFFVGREFKRRISDLPGNEPLKSIFAVGAGYLTLVSAFLCVWAFTSGVPRPEWSSAVGLGIALTLTLLQSALSGAVVTAFAPRLPRCHAVATCGLVSISGFLISLAASGDPKSAMIAGVAYAICYLPGLLLGAWLWNRRAPLPA